MQKPYFSIVKKKGGNFRGSGLVNGDVAYGSIFGATYRDGLERNVHKEESSKLLRAFHLNKWSVMAHLFFYLERPDNKESRVMVEGSGVMVGKVSCSELPWKV